MNELTILFWLRKNRARPDGTCPISCRVSFDGHPRAEISTGEWVHPSRWEYTMIDPKSKKEKVLNKQEVLGNKEDAKTTNNRLETIKNKIKAIYNKLDLNEELITPSAIKEIYEGRNSDHRKQTLIKALKFAIGQMKELVEKKKKKDTTVKRYEFTMANVERFLKHQYGKEDIFLRDMIVKGKPEFSFAADYEQYGKTVTNLNKEMVWSHNYCKKELGRINTMITPAIKQGWLDRNPLDGYSKKTKKGKPKYLKADQVELIEGTPFEGDSMNQVKDVFLFCCYTSLSYAEVFKLTYDHIAYGIDGHDWIFINRKKNEDEDDPGKICKIPLPDNAKELLKKYEDDPACNYKGKAMPVISNTNYNKYLKIIRDACNERAARENLSVRLPVEPRTFTTHIARHTCSRWLLDLGYSKEFVAEIFGHADTKLIGEIYGEITTTRMSMEINYVQKYNKLQVS